VRIKYLTEKIFIKINEKIALRIKIIENKMPVIANFSNEASHKFYLALDMFLKLREKIQIENSSGTNTNEMWLKNKVKLAKSSGSSEPYYTQFGEPNMEVLDKIEEVFNLKIIIWYKKSKSDKVYYTWESQKSPVGRINCMNIFSELFEPFSKKDLSKISLILDVQKFQEKSAASIVNTGQKNYSDKMNIFQALVRELHPKLGGQSFDEKVLDYQRQWGSDSICLSEIKKFYRYFKIGIQIWRTESKHKKRITKKIFDSFWKNRLVLSINQLNLSKPITLETKFFYIKNLEKLNHFSCSNKYCFFGTNDLQKYRVHENSCRTEPLVKYKQQKRSKPTDTVAKELFEEGILPNENFFNFFFCTYDIECLMSAPSEEANNSILSVHKLVSIAFKLSFKHLFFF
jgi:hypothetical protein